jgi:hypothetical protein
VVFKRLTLLQRLHEVDLESPEEAMALLERVKTPTSSTEDRARLAPLIRVTIEVTEHMRAAPDGQTPPGSKRPSAKSTSTRQRQLTKAARRRHRAERSRDQGLHVEAAS